MTKIAALLLRIVCLALVWGAIVPSPQVWAAVGDISDINKYAWSENSGWVNFKPTHGGVTVHGDHLSGYAWGEGIGWVKLGATGSGPYANSTATNWGVNRDPSGELSGYAWSESAGWINFSPSHSQVTINLATGDFNGYAWCETLGFIHLKNANPAYKVQTQLATVPDAPTNVNAVAGNGQATISFIPPALDGGSAIFAYTVTSNPGWKTASSDASPITVTGLTNGQAYTFTVTATNAMGTGPGSSPSNPVTYIPTYPVNVQVQGGTAANAIAAAGQHSVAVKNDGTVLAWGKNTFGQATVPIGLSWVNAIAAGLNHSMALQNDGTVLAWGSNSDGQSTIPAGLTGVTAIAAGAAHSLALKNNGTVVAWGNNDYDQSTVPTGLSGVVAIAAGSYHSVALKGDGTVLAWGYNGYGQSTVPSGLAGVSAIAAGSYHTVTLKSNGTVQAWGYNFYGQTTTPGALSGVSAIAAGGGHTMALKNDTTVLAWGDNSHGQSTVPGGLTGVSAIAAGANHSLVLKDDGTVQAWGRNDSGQSTVPGSLSGGLAHGSIACQSPVAGWTDSVCAITPDADYWLSSFTVNGEDRLAEVRANSFIITNVQASQFVSGSFAPLTVPGAPSIGTAIAGNGQATVSFTPPVVNGGSAITGYTVTASPGGLSVHGSANPLTISGLSNGTAYTFTVQAANAIGSGPASAPSNAVTPAVGAVSTVNLPGLVDSAVSDQKALVWMAYRNASGFIHKRSLVDGSLLSTITMPVSGPFTLIHDGVSIWAVNGSATVWKIDAATDAVIAFTMPAAIRANWYAFGSVWLGTLNAGAIYRVNPVTGAVQNTIALGAGTGIYSIGSSSGLVGVLTASDCKASFIDPASNAVVRTISLPDFGGCSMTLYQSGAWWLGGPDQLYRYDYAADTGATLAAQFDSIESWPISSDGLWIQNSHNSTLQHLNPEGQADRISDVNALFGISTTPRCYIDDGQRLWITDGANKLSLVPKSLLPDKVGEPGTLSVPELDSDGNFTVSWGPSPVSGVAYVLEESTDSGFINAQPIYSGSSVSVPISKDGTANYGTTYYYRVKATKLNLADSDWTTGANGCLVDTVAPAVSIGEPSAVSTHNLDISYTVTYSGASEVTLSASDITLVKTGTANGTVSVSGTGSVSRLVTVTNISGDGTMGIRIGAGTGSDLAGNMALAPAASMVFEVGRIKPQIVWQEPDPILYGTPLSATQLNAQADVPGTFTYEPGLDSVLNAGTSTITATFTPADPVNYSEQTATVGIAVNKARLNVSAAAKSKAYGASDPALTWSATGFVNGDTSAVVGGSLSRAAGEAVGIYLVSRGNLLAENYEISFIGANFSIVKATPALSWEQPGAIMYGTGLDTSQLHATADIAGSFSYSPAAGTVLNAGTQTLSATFTPVDSANYTSQTVSVSLSVGKTVLHVTADADNKIYGTSDPVLDWNASGYVNGDSSEAVTGNLSRQAGETAGNYAITRGTLSALNYTISFTPAVFTISKATPVVTWSAPEPITYGTALAGPQLNAAASIPGSFVYSPAAGVVLSAGRHALSVNFIPNDTTNYTTGSGTAELVVDKSVLNVIAGGKTKTHGAPDPLLTWSATGYVNRDSATAVTGSLSREPGEDTGSYPITRGSLAAANYDINFTSANLIINKAMTTITWGTPAGVTYGTALGEAQLNAAANVAGRFVYVPAAGTVLSAGQQTLSVTFTPDDTVNYIGQSAAVELMVNKAVLNISADAKTKTYGASDPPLTWNAAGYATGDSSAVVSGSLARSAGENAGAYPIAIGSLAAANYSIAYTGAMFTIDKATPELTWVTPADITYGTALDVLQLNATASVLGSFSYTPASGVALNAGLQTLSVTFTPADTANVAGKTATVELTVRKAALNISADSKSKAYGTSDPALTWSATGYTNGDASSVVTGSLTRQAGETAGSYPITRGSLTAANYAITFSGASLAISRATPQVNWPLPGPITYGMALGDAQLNASATVAGTFVFTPPAGSVLSPGRHTLTAVFSPSDTQNYTGKTTTVDLTIDKGNAMVLLDDLLQTRDGSPKAVRVATVPAGLPVIVTYNGNRSAPVAAGSYDVAATVDDTNYQGSARATLIIEPAAVLMGDAGGDGMVAIDDAILILKSVAGMHLSAPLYIEADSDGDQRLTVVDALFILGRIANE